MKAFISARKDRWVASLLAAVALPFILFISVPFDIFGNNLSESNFSIGDFIGTSIALFLLVAILLFLVMFLLPKKASTIFRHIVLALGFLGFVQGTYLVGSNSVSGDNLSTAGPNTFIIVLDILLWVAVIIGFIVLGCLKDKKGIIKIVTTVLPIIVLFTQLVNMLTVSVSVDGVFKSKAERDKTDGEVARILSDKNLTTVSNASNVLYFVVDRFDEAYAEDAYAKNKELFENLDGFTWFQDNISMYGHTFPAVSYMMTDTIYRAEDSLRDAYLKEAYQGDTPLKTLHDNGYTINLYSSQYYACSSKLPTYIDNAIYGEYTVNDHMGLSIELAGWCLARCLPMKIRDIVYVNTTSYNSYAVLKENSSGYNTWGYDNSTVYEYLANHSFTSTDSKVFSLIHTSGCHEPEEIFDGSNDKSNRYNSLMNSFAIINKYIEELKKNGSYKDTTIIITGDHGISHGDSSPLDRGVMTAMFFKPSGSEGTPLQFNKAQVSQENTWPTIMKSLGITDSKYYTMDGYYDVDPSKDYTRKQIWHTYASTLDEYVYEITGAGKNFNNWKLLETKHYDRFLMN